MSHSLLSSHLLLFLPLRSPDGHRPRVSLLCMNRRPALVCVCMRGGGRGSDGGDAGDARVREGSDGQEGVRSWQQMVHRFSPLLLTLDSRLDTLSFSLSLSTASVHTLAHTHSHAVRCNRRPVVIPRYSFLSLSLSARLLLFLTHTLSYQSYQKHATRSLAAILRSPHPS